MKTECGVTDISMDNAKFLISKYGKPDRIRLHKTQEDYVVTASWPHQGIPNAIVWDFTGFAWGYGGTGPYGLVKFLTDCGVDISIQEVASMDQEKEMTFNLDNRIEG